MILLAVIGCGNSSLRPKLSLLSEETPYQYSDMDYAAVLQDYVQDGLVDYEALAANPEPLERYYALLSVTGPDSTPDQFVTRAQKTAYWINAYNACVLRAVLEHYPISTMYDVTLPRLQSEYKFSIDGRHENLIWMEGKILEDSNGDVRALFATSRAAMGSPRLMDEPVRASSLDRQVQRATENALNNPYLLRVDHGDQAIYVWQLILRRQADFIQYWRTQRRGRRVYLYNVLCELAAPSQRQRLEDAIGYDLREMSFDRRLNDIKVRQHRSVP
jgi:hypothetical protein